MIAESPDDEERCDAFIEEAARALGFLHDRHGFSAASTEIDRRSATVTVTFAKDEVAIEAIHDLREGDVEVKVVRLESGRKPDAHQVDRRGRRCRAGFVEILMKRGGRGFGLRRPESQEAARQRVGRLLAQYARLVREHAEDILAGSAKALDELEPRSGPRST